jgi:type I restriction enzyme, R subunit
MAATHELSGRFIVEQRPEGLLVELPTLGYLCGDGSYPGVGWDYVYGPHIAPGAQAEERTTWRDIVLVGRLREAVRNLNPQLPGEAVDRVVAEVVTSASPVVIENHRALHRLLLEGVSVVWDDVDGTQRVHTARLIDWDDPDNNNFLAVNQFRLVVGKPRRLDVLLFVNGMPLGQIEAKRPGQDGEQLGDGQTGVDPSAVDAVNQIDYYRGSIPELYRYVEFVGVTDLRHARVGTIDTPAEHFAEWKTLDDDPAEQAKKPLQLMIEGAFQTHAFLDLVRNFVAFDSDGSRTWKVMAKYHQVHAVNAAVRSVVQAKGGSLKGGIVFHTTGSGKSLTMAFFVNKLLRRAAEQLGNPTIVMVTDRTDLDNQLAGTFARLPALVGSVDQAQDIDGGPDSLRSLLNRPAGGVIFTTIQKFQLTADEKAAAAPMPVISDRDNIIVIADEAHRTQYAQLAQNLTVALPNAVRVGFTGTPVELNDRSTRTVFGDYVSTYRMRQAQEDRATVPIYYESRQIPVAVEDPAQLNAVEALLEGEEEHAAAAVIREFTRLEKVVGSPQRIDRLVEDVTEHFTARQEVLDGKAMLVCYSRRIAAEVADRLKQTLGEDAVTAVITAQNTDDAQLRAYMRDKQEMEQVAAAFKKPDDPLKLVVVRDMWLTGFDVPSLHTLYVDKPMRQHGLLQAIARVNRVFRDKPGGLVVDYIGIGDELRDTLRKFANDDAEDPMIPIDVAVKHLREKADVLAAMLHPAGYRLSQPPAPTAIADLYDKAHDTVVVDEETTKRFLDQQAAFAKWYALCRTEAVAIELRWDATFFADLARRIKQFTPPDGQVDPTTRQAVKQFFSEGLGAGDVVELLDMSGDQRPELSVLSDEFLEKLGASTENANLRIRLLEKLLKDEVKARRRTNNLQAAAFSDEIKDLLGRYENRQLSSADVIKRLIEIAQAVRDARRRHEQLGLTPEEAAFYDALAGTVDGGDPDDQIKDIARALVQSIKADLTVDWTNRESTEAKIRKTIKRLLRTRGYTPPVQPNGNGGGGGGLDAALERILDQARTLYRYYPEPLDELDFLG